MSRTNLISASLSPEKKTEILKCLAEIQSGLNFLINISQADKKRLNKMGTRSVGYVDDCIAAFDTYPHLLPNNIDLEELKRDRALYESLNAIAMNVKNLNEGLQDTMAAISHDLMINCNDGYAVLKRGGKRDVGVQAATDRISRRFQGQGKRGGRIEAAVTNAA